MDLSPSCINWLTQRKSKLCHRQLLVISGQQAWVEASLKALLPYLNNNSLLWVGDAPQTQASIAIQDYRAKLGHEYANLIINCFSGFRANAVMALSGVVQSQGLMIICCPALADWPSYPDPEQSNRLSYGYQTKQISSQFIQYLTDSFQQDKSVALLTEQSFKGQACFVEQNAKPKDFSQQTQSVELIKKTALGRPNRPLVITAHRGRGKSSALGIAAAQLMQQNSIKIWISAPTINNVTQVFNHAQQGLTEPNFDKKRLSYQNSQLSFKAIDCLLITDELPDLLLIDEASAIPVNILLKLSKRFKRVVFSATQHGYEGSGKGFELRFNRQLLANNPQAKFQTLSHPIRWFEQDSLENFWFSSFFYHQPIDPKMSIDSSDKVCFQLVEQQWLLSQPDLLANIFALLLDAHYQTSPDDLQRLLDAPDIMLVIAKCQDKLIAAAQINLEGGHHLAPIADKISANERRVKGHLVAQNISSTYHFAEFCHSRQWRISRIAVCRTEQNKGIGSQLLAYIHEQALEHNVEFVTSAFGGSASLLSFWRKHGYAAYKVSHKAEVSSGEHSCIYINALTASAKAKIQGIHSEFCADLLFYMDKELQNLEADCLLELLKSSSLSLPSSNLAIIQHFVQGNRPLSSCKRLLTNYLLESRNNIDNLKGNEQALLIGLLLQNKAMDFLLRQFELTGKKQLTSKVRRLFQQILP
ncbi:tRNA(Met) cytidine acetyltransferase TmcA [Paraglaciecola aestuariivivens]